VLKGAAGDGSTMNTTVDAGTSRSGSFEDARAGDTGSDGSSIEFGSSSTEIPSEIGSNDDNQTYASSSATSSGERTAIPGTCALLLLVVLAICN